MSAILEVEPPTLAELKLVLNQLNRACFLKKELWEKDPIGPVTFEELLSIWVNRVEEDAEYRELAIELIKPLRKTLAEQNTPSVPAMAKNLATSVTQWAGSGFRMASEEDAASRLSVCNGCEFWNAEAFGNTGRCMKCGCSTQAKIRLSTSRCPVGKW